MADNFPASLQQKFNEAGFFYKIGETAIRTETDIGLPKVRRRFTKGIDESKGTITIKGSEVQTLKDFYNVTLDGGTKPFNFEDPFTQLPIEYRFKASPTFAPKGGENFTATLDLEILP